MYTSECDKKTTVGDREREGKKKIHITALLKLIANNNNAI